MNAAVVGLSLGSALAAALSTTFKKASAARAARQDAASGRSGRLAGLGRPLWLAGLACDLAGVALQVTALHYGPLAVVQPLLVTGLLFALVLRHIGVSRISGREILWGSVMVICLVGFLAFSGAMSGGANPGQADRVAAAVVGTATIVAVGLCLLLAHRTVPPTGRAALFGAAAGALYAATAALIKTSTGVLADHGIVALLSSWQLYCTLLTGAAGQLIAQLAFQAGPITSSLPATATVDPLLSVLIGVLIYDEHLHRGPGGGAVLFVLLLLLIAAVIQLGRVETEKTATDPAAEQPAAM